MFEASRENANILLLHILFIYISFTMFHMDHSQSTKTMGRDRQTVYKQSTNENTKQKYFNTHFMSSFELDRMEKQGSVYPDEKSFSLIDFINRHRLLIIILIATVIICMLVLISVSIIVFSKSTIQSFYTNFKNQVSRHLLIHLKS